jgi:hypothetical protein
MITVDYRFEDGQKVDIITLKVDDKDIVFERRNADLKHQSSYNIRAGKTGIPDRLIEIVLPQEIKDLEWFIKIASELMGLK